MVQSIPQHIAIIMDGNGRWAKNQNLPRIMGHKVGQQVVRKIVEICGKKGVKALTLFSFGLDNQKRPASEVAFLMNLFSNSLERYLEELHQNQVRFQVVGDRSRMTAKIQKLIADSEQRTAQNPGLVLTLAFFYSGRWDITQATQRVAEKVSKGVLAVHEITEELIQSHLALSNLPEPDLMIRTSGEQRISNFLLWQLAYTELYFTDVCWPDFSEAELDKAIHFYQTRERRFGKISEQLKEDEAC